MKKARAPPKHSEGQSCVNTEFLRSIVRTNRSEARICSAVVPARVARLRRTVRANGECESVDQRELAHACLFLGSALFSLAVLPSAFVCVAAAQDSPEAQGDPIRIRIRKSKSQKVKQ